MFSPNASPSSTPTRLIPRMPSIRLPLLTATSDSILPLSAPSSNNSPGRRSTSRRLSYNLKSRASRYSVPLILAGIVATFFLFTTFSREYRLPTFDRSEAVRPYSARPNGHPTNGVSLLIVEDEEIIAEDDLYWDNFTEVAPPSDAAVAAEGQLAANRANAQEQDRQHSVRALVWWLAQGGILPQTWSVPADDELKKIGGMGFERLLEGIDNGDVDKAIFRPGWADSAVKQYRTVIFSKTFCPYSRKAKGILEKYDLKPAPYIVELDKRSDFGQIQTLLKSLTGRRTVPNIILDFVSIGGSDEVTLLHAEGGLKRQFEEMKLITSWRRNLQATEPPFLPPPVVPEVEFERAVPVAPVPVPVRARDLVDPDQDDFLARAEHALPVQKRTHDVLPYETELTNQQPTLRDVQQYELADDLVLRHPEPARPVPAREERIIQKDARDALPALASADLNPRLQSDNHLDPRADPILVPRQIKPVTPLRQRALRANTAPSPRQEKANGAIALVAAAKMRRTRGA